MRYQFEYLKYLSPHTPYYEPLPSESYENYKVNNVLSEWEVIDNDVYWIMYHNPQYTMPIQGFKIHVSTTFEEAQPTLDVVSQLLIKKGVPFKHVNHIGNLNYTYSKHGDRVAAGKFITIYPTEEDFVPLLEELHKALYKQEIGPYILNDKQYKDGNVYYRYGAFAKIVNESGEMCIYDPDGNLIPDIRSTKFTLPSFVSLPIELVKIEEEFEKQQTVTAQTNNFSLYKITGVIRFSNAGGIYTAERKSDGKKVIIKEARPAIGLDGDAKTAFDRIEVEYNSLKKLTGVQGIVQVIDYFVTWKHKFLVIEYLEAITLHSFLARSYPFMNTESSNEYFNKTVSLIKQIIQTVTVMHEKGVAMCDLTPQNILVNNNEEITIIDFEAALNVNSTDKSSLATRGYIHPENVIAKDKDWYAVNRILHTLLMPIGAVADIDMSLNKHHNYWILQNFGQDNYNRFLQLINQINQNITNYKNIFEDTYNLTTKPDLITCPDKLLQLLVEGIHSNTDYKRDSFINGDIRQYEQDGGKYSLQNGGFGAILALHRADSIRLKDYRWIDKQLGNLTSIKCNGYLTGKSGIAVTLHQLGYVKEATELIDQVVNSYDLNSNNISLRSGLAGIGIAQLYFYNVTGKHKYLNTATKIANNILNKQDIKGTDWDTSSTDPRGLLDGFTGASILFTYMHATTDYKKYLAMSITAIKKDLKHTINDSNNKNDSLHLVDERNRALPYLSNGSVGIGVAIDFLNKTTGNDHFVKELDLIKKQANTRMAIDPSFIDGLGGFLLIESLGQDKAFKASPILSNLNMYLIKRDNMLLMAGRMFYRLSNDLQTGNAGIILGLLSAKHKNPLYWLPSFDSIPQVNKKKDKKAS